MKQFNHPCIFCERFTSSFGLRLQIQRHFSDKPYHCCTCFKEFCDASNRKRHEVNWKRQTACLEMALWGSQDQPAELRDPNGQNQVTALNNSVASYTNPGEIGGPGIVYSQFPVSVSRAGDQIPVPVVYIPMTVYQVPTDFPKDSSSIGAPMSTLNGCNADGTVQQQRQANSSEQTNPRLPENVYGNSGTSRHGMPGNRNFRAAPIAYRGQTMPPAYRGQSMSSTYRGQSMPTTYRAQLVTPAYRGQFMYPAYYGQSMPTAYCAQPATSGYSQPPMIPANNGQPMIPANNGQPMIPANNGQPVIPPNNGQPMIPANNGQPVIPPNNGQPMIPANNGQPMIPANNGQPMIPAYSGQPPAQFYSGQPLAKFYSGQPLTQINYVQPSPQTFNRQASPQAACRQSTPKNYSGQSSPQANCGYPNPQYQPVLQTYSGQPTLQTFTGQPTPQAVNGQSATPAYKAQPILPVPTGQPITPAFYTGQPITPAHQVPRPRLQLFPMRYVNLTSRPVSFLVQAVGLPHDVIVNSAMIELQALTPSRVPMQCAIGSLAVARSSGAQVFQGFFHATLETGWYQLQARLLLPVAASQGRFGILRDEINIKITRNYTRDGHGGPYSHFQAAGGGGGPGFVNAPNHRGGTRENGLDEEEPPTNQRALIELRGDSSCDHPDSNTRMQRRVAVCDQDNNGIYQLCYNNPKKRRSYKYE